MRVHDSVGNVMLVGIRTFDEGGHVVVFPMMLASDRVVTLAIEELSGGLV